MCEPVWLVGKSAFGCFGQHSMFLGALFSGLPTGLYNCRSMVLPCIVQELCESRSGRPGLSVLTRLLISVDVKLY